MQVSGLRTAVHYKAEWKLISLLSSPMHGWLELRPIGKTKVWDRFAVYGWGFSACGNAASKENVSATVLAVQEVANDLLVNRSIQSVVNLADTCELSLNADDCYQQGPNTFYSESCRVNFLSGSPCVDSSYSGQTFVQGPVGKNPAIWISSPFDDLQAFLSSDLFHGYHRCLYSEWITGSRVFLDAYKRDLYKQIANSCVRFAELCGRAVHLALLLGRQIEMAFHRRLIEPRVFQTLFGA